MKCECRLWREIADSGRIGSVRTVICKQSCPDPLTEPLRYPVTTLVTTAAASRTSAKGQWIREPRPSELKSAQIERSADIAKSPTHPGAIGSFVPGTKPDPFTEPILTGDIFCLPRAPIFHHRLLRARAVSISLPSS